MPSLQEEMLSILANREMPLEELVSAMKSRHPDMLTFDIRSALLPLMSTYQIELDKDGKVRVAKQLEPALV
jgi:hypothetical protein